jgi:hypothetical protein
VDASAYAGVKSEIAGPWIRRPSAANRDP